MDEIDEAIHAEDCDDKDCSLCNKCNYTDRLRTKYNQKLKVMGLKLVGFLLFSEIVLILAIFVGLPVMYKSVGVELFMEQHTVIDSFTAIVNASVMLILGYLFGMRDGSGS